MSFRSMKHAISAAAIVVMAAAGLSLPTTAHASPPTISSFSWSNLP